MTAPSDRLDLKISRTLDVPRALVWRAWADPRQLEKWWTPKPWTTEVRGFELRPGGAFETIMRGPDGQESDNAGAFLDVVARERIVFTSVLSSGWRPVPKPMLPMTAIITMADEGEGTRYEAIVLHADEEGRELHKSFGFHEGWNTAIDQLAAVAADLDRGGSPS